MHLAGGTMSFFHEDIRFNDVLLDTMTTEGKLIKKSFRFQR